MAKMTKVAAIQMQMGIDREQNVERAKEFVVQAAKNGAQVILLPELFEGLYFCKDMDEKYFSWARELEGHPVITQFSEIAREYGVVVLVSYFEKAGENYFNSLVALNTDGSVMQNYRKTHIPDGPGYEEKFYFANGDSGYVVYETEFGKIGVGICWDQWFPEVARSLTLMGADIIFYPTAIGSEPEIKVDSKEHWQRVQMGHSAANTIPVVAANRIGKEIGESCEITFYGSSFITDYTGAKIAEASREKEEILYAEFDFEDIAQKREYWGLIRDRVPQSYTKLCE